MGSRHDIPVNKPLSVMDKPLKVKFKDLFNSLTKSAAQGIAGKADGAIKDAIDSLSAVNFGADHSGIAWLLIFRSLLQAIYTLVAENEPLLIKDTAHPRVVQYQLGDLAEDPDSLMNQLDWSLEKKQFAIDETFFKRPRALSVLEDIKTVFSQWLERFGLTEAQSQAITDRLPSYFVFALNDQWRHRSEEYIPLKEAFDTPFTKASETEQNWARYSAWLQKQVDEGMFDETFSLRQVYIPLRGYFEQKTEDGKDFKETKLEYRLHGERDSQKVVVDLTRYLEAWLNKLDVYDTIKVISGGPGSGKSSFAKMFAALQAGKTGRRVLFIPLHRFDTSDDLIIAVGNFVRFDQFLKHNPLDPQEGDSQLLIIFDGLDELAEQGKAAQELAQQFIAEVQKKTDQFNGGNAPRLKVIISGRELIVQANASEFRRPQQIINVLPYLIKEDEREEYKGEKELIALDQRHQWWEAYGKASGKPYADLPEALKRKELLEITSQPLLNYLIALSYDRGKLDFSTESNLNNIYQDLLEAVYQRRWAQNPHPATKDVEERQFVRILEEVAVAAWHGDGRKTTVREIEAHCETSGLKNLLGALQEGASKGVTRLLMAFYFRRAGNTVAGDQTFEFTHKSFGEYLAARRIVGVIAHLHDEMQRRKDNFESGYDERIALEYWLKLCGPVAMDRYVFDFIRNEMMLRDITDVAKWQDSLISLINFVLRNGMPMDRLIPRPTFQEELRQARNSEEALLCALNICATLTERVSKIDWPAPYSCGEWIARLQGQRGGSENVMTLDCLSFLDLENCYLAFRDLLHANLRNTNLKSASLAYANLDGAKLEGVNFEQCNFMQASLKGADFGRKSASANVKPINFKNAYLDRANLSKTNLSMVNLEGAYSPQANLAGTILSNANLKGILLRYADLRGAVLVNANLEEADLRGADLRNADLRGANLNETMLDGANLDGIKVGDENLRNEYLQRAKQQILETTTQE